jgi:hypothetical protein
MPNKDSMETTKRKMWISRVGSSIQVYSRLHCVVSQESSYFLLVSSRSSESLVRAMSGAARRA